MLLQYSELVFCTALLIEAIQNKTFNGLRVTVSPTKLRYRRRFLVQTMSEFKYINQLLFPLRPQQIDLLLCVN